MPRTPRPDRAPSHGGWARSHPEEESCPHPTGTVLARGRHKGEMAVRRLMGAVVGAALAVALGCAPAAPAFVQGCGGTSWVGGATNVCEGKVVYRDYVYDDEGADTGGIGYDAAGT